MYLPKLFDLSEPAVDLVTHGGNDVKDGNEALLVDKRLSPDLGVDFVARLQVLADGVLALCNPRQLLAPVNVDTGLRLTQHRPTVQNVKGVLAGLVVTYHLTLSNLFPMACFLQFLL